VDVVQAAAEAGIQAVQFREKDLSICEQLHLVETIQKVTKPYGVKLFINDRIDLALAVNADGVHLPENGLPVSVARSLMGPQKMIGVSCHSLETVFQAQNSGADFALLGPVYDTPSKRAYGAPLGIDRFRLIRQSTKIPLFAVGGIGESQLDELVDAGADSVAVVSSIMGSPDVGARCAAILNRIRKRKGKN
jgi:thiamine-phosphate pyrophosphorylase